MANRVTFEAFGTFQSFISRAEVEDLIGVLYRGPEDKRFSVIGQLAPGTKKTTLANCVFLSYENTHVIRMDLRKISAALGHGNMGGNRPAPTLRMALAMVLAHEIQHANQAVNPFNHRTSHSKPFQSYHGRAQEIDARRSVDENIEVIARVMNEKAPYNAVKVAEVEPETVDLKPIVDDLCECETLTVEDLNEELRSIGASNPKNLQALRAKLEKKGVQIF
jgi:hypothetical protein